MRFYPSAIMAKLQKGNIVEKEFEYGYAGALQAAGANVIEFKHFGSYQGDWWAKVEFGGKTGWIHGYFGSCPYCDAFEAEFGWDAEERIDYKQKMADFGKTYLDTIYSQEEAEEAASENLDWDMEAVDMVKFIKANADCPQPNMTEQTNESP